LRIARTSVFGSQIALRVRGDDPRLASYLRIEERELEAGGARERRRVSE
jgi:hypothetical protein